MAVLAPDDRPPLLARVSHLPHGDWRIGLPFYFCALLQALGQVIACLHFSNEHATMPRRLTQVEPPET